MAIIDTVRVNDKNTNEVNTKDGLKLVMTYRVYPSDLYIKGIWLPKNVQMGDVVNLYIEQFEKKENGEYTNFEASYPKANKNFLLSDNSNVTVTKNEEPNPFGATEELGSDVDLPF